MTATRSAVGLWADALLDAGVRGRGSSFSREDREAGDAVTTELDAIFTRADSHAGELLARSQPKSLLSRLFACA
ncbi:hypothetical protein [Aquisalimonas sp.]|uniref:hypothetical protein n=1 Tax=unclassified Aquisalimonas TaxID=2644645 RepID=UPI0025C349FB|nr:hypothetical protein [Aquisalimonas sp.]